MGYCVRMNESTIKIKYEYSDNIIDVLQKYIKDNDLPWIDYYDVMESYTLPMIMESIRYVLTPINDYEYEIDYFTGEKLGDDFKLFAQIAPYIEDGYIEYQGEDGDLWRYVFKDGKVREVYPKIVWK